MSYHIVADSCCDLPEAARRDPHFEIVSLTLEIGDYRIQDDENFDQSDFIRRVAACPHPAKTACPSPEAYMRAYDNPAEDIYVVTLSSHLSGSYNAAILGRELYLEEHPEKNIHVVDALSSCCGEAQIALRIQELCEEGKSFEEVVTEAEAFRDGMLTLFVLDNLDTLRKNGRLTGVKSLVASTLNVKPVMAGDRGVIVQKGQGIGTRKALVKMVEILQKEAKDTITKRLMITHVNCYERAMTVLDMILARMKFRDAIVVDAAGVSTVYAGDGGIVVTC
ncbi:MAG: DegV family protein [Lachnospiraceae bacterium]|nr:DegV family protein [Lachnospiraceae bacterium]